MSEKQSCRGSFLALTPLLVFLACYLAVSLVAGDFYRMPISVAFIAASAYAVAITRRVPFAERISRFSAGAADPNVLLMIWIFVLAGAFAESARSMGAVDATVDLTLHLLPGRLLPAGLFLASCFISLSVGTSVGTIVALVPVAAGLSSETGMNEAWLTAIVVGGVFFGDNLSFISDTTIAATRTQECDLRDKFRVNVRIVAPAAVVTLLVYLLTGSGADAVVAPGRVEWVRVLPYLLVLVTAIAGMNVLKVLLLGIAASGAIGLATGSFDLLAWCGGMGQGITGMGELIIVTMMAGGLLELIRFNGGIDYIIGHMTRRISGRRGGRGDDCRTGLPLEPLHGQQHDRHPYRRPDCPQDRRPVRRRSPAERQPARHLLLLHAGAVALRSPAAHGRGADGPLAAGHHPLPLLSRHHGRRGRAGHPAALSAADLRRPAGIGADVRRPGSSA